MLLPEGLSIDYIRDRDLNVRENREKTLSLPQFSAQKNRPAHMHSGGLEPTNRNYK